MDPLLIALAVAGLLIGATGTWSPCGFSMIETIGPTGHVGGVATTLAAAATFGPFAVVGAVATFGAASLLGAALPGAAGPVAYVAAAAVALAAAVAEARGVPIVPQVRRQLPIGWRRRLPMPVAAAGYGVLLGLGFTTFVLSYGVWALIGICVVLGDPEAGLAVGIAFGLGRALPIVALAPLADRRSGRRICESMATNPGLLRGARAGDAAALTVVAAALLAGAGSAGAANPLDRAERVVVRNGSDPSAVGHALAYEARPGRGILLEGGAKSQLPGTDPAVGGPWLAVIHQGRVEVRDRATLALAGTVAAKRADALAISRDWLAIRLAKRRGDRIVAIPLSAAGEPGRSVAVTRVRRPGQLSRPAVSGRSLVVARSRRGRSSLQRARLGAGGARMRTLISSRHAAYTGPSIAGAKIAYVLTTKRHQAVRIKGSGRGRGRTVSRRGDGPPTLWTTALAPGRVYVTVVARSGRGGLIAVRR
jgi:hypothetical protein